MEKLNRDREVYYSLEDVGKDVERTVAEAYQAKDKMVHMIKAQTSTGKTTAYLSLMKKNKSKRFLITAPTNILKNEIYDNAVGAGIDVFKTPSLEEIKDGIPPKVRKRIEKLYRIGRYRSVHPYIEEILKKRNDIPDLREYMQEKEKLKDCTGSVITTHRYLTNMDEKRLMEYDAVIIDEDIILKSVIPNQSGITVSDLKKLLKDATDSRLAKKIKKLLKLTETETAIELPAFDLSGDEEEGEGMPTLTDIPSFCMATHFYYVKASDKNNLREDTVFFLKPVTFKDIKYIMVSATANEQICRYYFGEDRVKFYECKRAENTGVLNQYPQKSMSRSSIDKTPDILRRIIKRFGIEDRYVITHKKYGIGSLHFGNTEGCNFMEGKDILVIGTPYHSDFIYKLFAFTIGLDFDVGAEMVSCAVVHNDFRFPFTTYNDKVLRDIHFWMIESELEQAIGRARLLRHPCTVNLFSNFPIRQAVMRESDYDNGNEAEKSEQIN
jgi:hypothetical protein